MASPPSNPPLHAIDAIHPRGARRVRIAVRRRIASGLVLAALAIASGSTLLQTDAAVAADASDAAPSLTGIDERPLDLRWRARGVAFIDLPLGLRARYDARALHRLSADDLAAAFTGIPIGIAPHGTRLLESRFALSRVLAPRVELELSWAARSPLTMVDLLRIEDQRVAAMIRFVP